MSEKKQYQISMIAAIGSNRELGKDNDLIWHLPDDMKFFKQATNGHAVIMGRKNYESIPPKWRPLPNRLNVVLTTNQTYSNQDVVVCHHLEDAIEVAKAQSDKEEIFIIGGGQIYELGLAYATRIYLTEIHGTFDADVFFPEFDRNEWQEMSRRHHPVDEKHQYSFDFVTYEKKDLSL
ncbi:MAG: dihydrofolate reductase [Bacteroidota bacterium]